MNTWLPDSDFTKSAEMLDHKRLNRQRADVVNVLKACCEPKPDTQKEHPAITMWRGSEQFLIQYGVAVCLEWRARGNSDTLLSKVLSFSAEFPEGDVKPEWLGDEPFHKSHRSYLKRLLPSWYGLIFPDLRDDLPLIWPRQENKVSEERLEREKERNRKRAIRATEKAQRAVDDARRMAVNVGLHPDTFEELTEAEQYQFELSFKEEDNAKAKVEENSVED